MKRSTWVLALAGLVLAVPAGAYDIMQNGGFEAGNLSGWQIFNQGAAGGTGSWYAKTGTGNGTYSGLPTSPPPTGSWEAVADNSGKVAAILYQDITIPSTARATLSLTLWYGSVVAFVNGSSLSPSISNQRVRIDVIQTTANLLLLSPGVLQLIYASTPGPAASFTPFTVSVDVTALAGQTVRLRCALVGANGAMIAGIDNVKLDVSPFAPTTLPVALDGGAAHFGDFDGDGRYEVAQMGSDGANGRWTVAKWDGATSTWSQVQNLVGMRDGDMALADIDRDGDLDMGGVGTTNSVVHDLAFQRNEGAFSFTFLEQSDLYGDPGTRFGSIDWGDFDQDGDLDALVTGTGVGEVAATYLDLNDGSANFDVEGLNGVPAVSGGNAMWSDIVSNGGPDVTMCGAEQSGSFLYSSLGYNPMSFGSLPTVTEGALTIGELTNDGHDDVILTGMNGSTPITKVYKYDTVLGSIPAWTEISTGLPGVYQGAVAIGDFDADGWNDIAICGNTGSGLITRVYHNNGNQTFTDINAGLPGVKFSSIEFGDFDGDGKPDLLLQGNDGTNRIARAYVNTQAGPNAKPLAMGGLSESLSGSTLNLTTPPAAFMVDDHTLGLDLTINFRAGTSPGTCDVIPAMSNLTTGKRMVPRQGSHHEIRPLSFTAFGHGSLYWSAQAIDQAYLGSDWAPERVFTPGPRITQIQDVPGDQGGHVRLTLDHSMLDTEAYMAYPATGYDVWRLVPAGSMTQAIAREGVPTAALSGREAATGLPMIAWQGRRFTRSPGVSFASPFPAGTWEIVGSFYATQQSSYLVASTTLADSGVGGVNNQTFLVTVHTTTPTVWFASLPASGHSVDNLAPNAPTGLSSAYHTGSGNQLAWQPAPEPDFASFHVYRGTTPGFTPGPSNLVASVSSPGWTDPSYDSPTVYYRVSTLDHAGNESPAVAPGSTTAVDAQDVPLAFTLESASPNPFGSATHIAFALPRSSEVRLDVFDAGGRLVNTLLDGTLPAGKHEASWSGADRDGRRVEAGLYFYRLHAGSFTASRRVAFVP